MYYVTLFLKVALVIVGSLVAGVAQFIQWPPEGSPTTWQLVGVIATCLVAVGAISVAFLDQDASKELESARKALEVAQTYQEVIADFDRLEAINERASQLYLAVSAMREVIEKSVVQNDVDEVALIANMLVASKRSLAVAYGFNQTDQWTTSVYRAETRADGVALICVATARAIECPVTSARYWMEGRGVTGHSFANQREVIVPDLHAPELGSAFQVDAPGPHDADRYKSIVAVPVRVSNSRKPWGVVVATNDRVNHFNTEHETGTKTAEAARAHAGMIALAVEVCRRAKTEKT